MALIEFDQNKPMDIVLIGRAAIDFNPNEMAHCGDFYHVLRLI